MSEKLASIEKKGGGKMSETVLWTNPSPSSNRSGTNTITLSESYENYDFIRIKFKYVASTSASSTNPGDVKSVYISSYDLTAYNGPTVALSRINGSGGYVASRYVYSPTNERTTLKDVCVNNNATDSAIIVEVSGIKF